MPSLHEPNQDPRTSLPSFLKPFWSRRFRLDWQLGLALILLFGIPRFYLVMQAYVDGSYQWVSVLFLVMMAVPYVLMTKFRAVVDRVDPAGQAALVVDRIWRVGCLLRR